jgi:hypothetical protein
VPRTPLHTHKNKPKIIFPGSALILYSHIDVLFVFITDENIGVWRAVEFINMRAAEKSELKIFALLKLIMARG